MLLPKPQSRAKIGSRLAFLWPEIKNENLPNTTGLLPDRLRDHFPIAPRRAAAEFLPKIRNECSETYRSGGEFARPFQQIRGMADRKFSPIILVPRLAGAERRAAKQVSDADPT